MPHSTEVNESSSSPSLRGYGPAVGEPPIFVDPRRWGSMIGVAGGMWFIAGDSAALGQIFSITAIIAGASLVAAILFAHYIRPVALGAAARPGVRALLIYCAAVVAEFTLINVAGRALDEAGNADLRPALIAAVVGLHFIPFAWAFDERMFYWLGTLVAAIGAVGLLVGLLGVPHAADAAAVIAGLTMQVIILQYARGRFARHNSVLPTKI